MLTTKDYKAKMGTPCPYGRKTNVGDTICVNCKFFHIAENCCSGDAEAVVRHMRNLKLDY